MKTDNYKVKWYQFKKKKPTHDGLFLIYSPKFITVAWWHKRLERWDCLPEAWGDAMTHWALLPDSPEE